MGTTAYKLSYLRNTKSLLKDKVNELVGDITDETTFAEYAEEIKNLYDDLPKITESGSSITLSNTKNGKMTIQLKGNTIQATSILPSEYQQVEYIEATGTQYIDTGIIPNNNTKMTAKVAKGAAVANSAWIGSANAKMNVPVATGTMARFFSKAVETTSILVDIREPVYVELNKDIYKINDTVFDINYTDEMVDTTSIVTCGYNLQGELYNSTIIIWNLQIYNNNILVRDFIPCYRKSDTEIGLYDLVNGVFYINAGTGTFLKGSNVSIPNPDYPQNIQVVKGSNNVWVGYGILPSGYQQIEYIEGTGTQYIDLGFKGTKNHGVEMECAFTSTSSNAAARLFGTREGSGGTGAFAYISSSNGNCNGTYYIASNGVSAGSSTFAQIDTNYHNIKINIDNDKKVYFDNNLIFTGNNTEYTATYNTRLFNSYNGTSWMSTCASAKIKTLKIYENTTLVKNFVPCYRKSDNVIGLYDLVNNVFYTNDGTGTFLKGNDVNSQSFSLSLGNIELCKIGDYSDIIFKNEPNNPLYDNSLLENEWYKKNVIEKIVYDGSNDENWQYITVENKNVFVINCTNVNIPIWNVSNKQLCNYFKIGTPGYQTKNCFSLNDENKLSIQFNDFSTVANFKNWLSTHNTLLYYLLKTPTYTQITDTTLVDQLEQLNRIIIPNNNTLIVITDSESSNAQLIVNASALKTWEVT